MEVEMEVGMEVGVELAWATITTATDMGPSIKRIAFTLAIVQTRTLVTSVNY